MSRNIFNLSVNRLLGRNAAAGSDSQAKTLSDFGFALADTTDSLLGGSRDSVFEAMTVESSNPNIVTGAAVNGAVEGIFQIKVERLANSTTVLSDQLKSKDANDFGDGLFEFSIYRQGEKFFFRVRVDQRDTNEDLLNNIADTINEADIGISAVVNKNTLADTSQLELRGLEPQGTGNFNVRDTIGSLLKDLGISLTQEAAGDQGGVESGARNAKFTINGVPFESKSNRVTLFDNSLVLNLKNVSYREAPEDQMDRFLSARADGLETFYNRLDSYDSRKETFRGENQGSRAIGGSSVAPVTIRVMPDTEKAASEIERFVSQTNDLFGRLSSSLVQSESANFKHPGNALDAKSDALEDIGISKNEDGELEVDGQTLRKALQTDFSKIRDLFAGPEGLAAKFRFGLNKILYAPISGLETPSGPGDSLPGFSGFLFDRAG